MCLSIKYMARHGEPCIVFLNRWSLISNFNIFIISDPKKFRSIPILRFLITIPGPMPSLWFPITMRTMWDHGSVGTESTVKPISPFSIRKKLGSWIITILGPGVYSLYWFATSNMIVVFLKAWNRNFLGLRAWQIRWNFREISKNGNFLGSFFLYK